MYYINGGHPRAVDVSNQRPAKQQRRRPTALLPVLLVDIIFERAKKNVSQNAPPAATKKRRTDMIYRDGTDDPATAADLPALSPPHSKRPHLADQRPLLLLLLLTIIPADLLDLTPAHDGRSVLHMA